MADGILKVGQIQTSSGSGTITIGQSGETITIPSGATVSGAGTNTPAFEAVKTGSSNQTFSTSFTKITFDSESYDTNSNFASNRFTPTIAGKYLLTYQIMFTPSGSNVEDGYSSIYKNGSELANYAKDQHFGGSGATFQDGQDSTFSLSIVDTANGSSDYYEIYAYFSGTTIVKYAQFSGQKLIGV